MVRREFETALSGKSVQGYYQERGVGRLYDRRRMEKIPGEDITRDGVYLR
jgi:hypothetical protein